MGSNLMWEILTWTWMHLHVLVHIHWATSRKLIFLFFDAAPPWFLRLALVPKAVPCPCAPLPMSSFSFSLLLSLLLLLLLPLSSLLFRLSLPN
ncbi:hypothetical protein J3F84DRAFT_366253 [Trichoderma pleuroticola]